MYTHTHTSIEISLSALRIFTKAAIAWRHRNPKKGAVMQNCTFRLVDPTSLIYAYKI